MLLGLRTYGSVVNNGTAAYSTRALIDRDSGIEKVSVSVRMAEALFGKLTSRTGHAVIMALDAGRRVEHRTQPGAWIMSSFKLRLIQSKGVAGRLSYSVTDALRSGIHGYFACWADDLPERGSGKAGWRLSRGLLCDEGNCGGSNDK